MNSRRQCKPPSRDISIHSVTWFTPKDLEIVAPLEAGPAALASHWLTATRAHLFCMATICGDGRWIAVSPDYFI